MMPDNADLKYEELNGEIVVLDAGAGVVHRLSGEAAEAGALRPTSCRGAG